MKDAIKDYQVYLSRMSCSMMDKLFFVDKIEDVDYFIDYGCSDGTLLKYLSNYTDATLLGYDSNREMLEKAKANRISNAFFFSDWDKLLLYRDKKPLSTEIYMKAAVILSSIIHEIYHYSTPQDIESFWKRFFYHYNLIDYIVIRDMIPSRSISRCSDVNDVTKVYRKFLYKQELTDFENIWGSIENNKNLIHFLLKYKYREPNWQREVKENYMPLYREDLLALIPDDFEIIYHEHYVLPYIKTSVMKDMDIEIKDPTHLKMILKRKEP